MYREENIIVDCLVKKGICNIDSSIWWSNFSRDVLNFSFKDFCGSCLIKFVEFLIRCFLSPKTEEDY